MLQVPESFFDAPWRLTAALNRFILAIAHSNLHFGFELARAKTISDVLKMQAEYWQRLLNASHGGEFPNWLVRPGASGSPVNEDESVTGEHSHSQQKEQKAASRPVMGTAANKPEQASEQGPKRSAAKRASAADKKTRKNGSKPKNDRSPSRRADITDNAVRLATKTPKRLSEQSPQRSAAKRASAVERKAEKIRPKPKGYRPPSPQADTGARKRPARQDSISPGRRVEIHFGRLDDSAVRFTSREAWRLRNGSWRRISVDKVLSDAVVLSKTRFDQLFPKVPQLPGGAFLPDQE